MLNESDIEELQSEICKLIHLTANDYDQLLICTLTIYEFTDTLDTKIRPANSMHLFQSLANEIENNNELTGSRKIPTQVVILSIISLANLKQQAEFIFKNEALSHKASKQKIIKHIDQLLKILSCALLLTTSHIEKSAQPESIDELLEIVYDDSGNVLRTLTSSNLMIIDDTPGLLPDVHTIQDHLYEKIKQFSATPRLHSDTNLTDTFKLENQYPLRCHKSMKQLRYLTSFNATLIKNPSFNIESIPMAEIEKIIDLFSLSNDNEAVLTSQSTPNTILDIIQLDTDSFERSYQNSLNNLFLWLELVTRSAERTKENSQKIQTFKSLVTEKYLNILSKRSVEDREIKIKEHIDFLIGKAGGETAVRQIMINIAKTKLNMNNAIIVLLYFLSRGYELDDATDNTQIILRKKTGQPHTSQIHITDNECIASIYEKKIPLIILCNHESALPESAATILCQSISMTAIQPGTSINPEIEKILSILFFDTSLPHNDANEQRLISVLSRETSGTIIRDYSVFITKRLYRIIITTQNGLLLTYCLKAWSVILRCVEGIELKKEFHWLCTKMVMALINLESLNENLASLRVKNIIEGIKADKRYDKEEIIKRIKKIINFIFHYNHHTSETKYITECFTQNESLTFIKKQSVISNVFQFIIEYCKNNTPSDNDIKISFLNFLISQFEQLYILSNPPEEQTRKELLEQFNATLNIIVHTTSDKIKDLAIKHLGNIIGKIPGIKIFTSDSLIVKQGVQRIKTKLTPEKYRELSNAIGLATLEKASSPQKKPAAATTAMATTSITDERQETTLDGISDIKILELMYKIANLSPDILDTILNNKAPFIKANRMITAINNTTLCAIEDHEKQNSISLTLKISALTTNILGSTAFEQQCDPMKNINPINIENIIDLSLRSLLSTLTFPLHIDSEAIQQTIALNDDKLRQAEQQIKMMISLINRLSYRKLLTKATLANIVRSLNEKSKMLGKLIMTAYELREGTLHIDKAFIPLKILLIKNLTAFWESLTNIIPKLQSPIPNELSSETPPDQQQTTIQASFNKSINRKRAHPRKESLPAIAAQGTQEKQHQKQSPVVGLTLTCRPDKKADPIASKETIQSNDTVRKKPIADPSNSEIKEMDLDSKSKESPDTNSISSSRTRKALGFYGLNTSELEQEELLKLCSAAKGSERRPKKQKPKKPTALSNRSAVPGNKKTKTSGKKVHKRTTNYHSEKPQPEKSLSEEKDAPDLKRNSNHSIVSDRSKPAAKKKKQNSSPPGSIFLLSQQKSCISDSEMTIDYTLELLTQKISQEDHAQGKTDFLSELKSEVIACMEDLKEHDEKITQSLRIISIEELELIQIFFKEWLTEIDEELHSRDFETEQIDPDQEEAWIQEPKEKFQGELKLLLNKRTHLELIIELINGLSKFLTPETSPHAKKRKVSTNEIKSEQRALIESIKDFKMLLLGNFSDRDYEIIDIEILRTDEEESDELLKHSGLSLPTSF